MNDDKREFLNNPKLKELSRVYLDLEKTLKSLQASARKRASKNSVLGQLNVSKLILQLSRSKRRLERKMANTILLERQHLKKRLRALASSLHSHPRETQS